MLLWQKNKKKKMGRCILCLVCSRMMLLLRLLMMMMAMAGSIIENGAQYSGEEKAKQILRFRCSCNFIRP